ncbi:hypothetical protein L1049_006852 [Liquidambar formosana]|uniref:DUF8039 domain-containing protein n=1 Tax=Liquidambar formosana TaxID=63359 RepID=A0AAP0WRI4_LIQFO
MKRMWHRQQQQHLSKLQRERWLKKNYNHRISRRGYARFGKDLQKTLKVSTNLPRHVIWKYAHQNKQGGYNDDKTMAQAEKIDEVTKGVEDGTIHTEGRNDILRIALGTPEHSGVRASKPCKLAVGTINNIVAHGTVFDRESPDEKIHTVMLGESYRRVSVNYVLSPNALLPVPIPDEMTTLRDAHKSYVAWPKDLICPKQPNDVECGYYVMRYMKELIENQSIPIEENFNGKYTYTPEEIDEVRVEWINFIQEYV